MSVGLKGLLDLLALRRRKGSSNPYFMYLFHVMEAFIEKVNDQSIRIVSSANGHNKCTLWAGLKRIVDKMCWTQLVVIGKLSTWSYFPRNGRNVAHARARKETKSDQAIRFEPSRVIASASWLEGKRRRLPARQQTTITGASTWSSQLSSIHRHNYLLFEHQGSVISGWTTMGRGLSVLDIAAPGWNGLLIFQWMGGYRVIKSQNLSVHASI